MIIKLIVLIAIFVGPLELLAEDASSSRPVESQNESIILLHKHVEGYVQAVNRMGSNVDELRKRIRLSQSVCPKRNLNTSKAFFNRMNCFQSQTKRICRDEDCYLIADQIATLAFAYERLVSERERAEIQKIDDQTERQQRKHEVIDGRTAILMEAFAKVYPSCFKSTAGCFPGAIADFCVQTGKAKYLPVGVCVSVLLDRPEIN